jgi:glycogen operon protein
MRIRPGTSYPLGATWDGQGVNFALFSEHATAVELCLFDSPSATEEAQRIPLTERTDMVWHGYLPDVRPGQLYGYRVHGPYRPRLGHRFNPAKVLLDPYAKAVGRPLTWRDELFGYRKDDPTLDLSRDERDNAAFAPLAAVIDPAFTWGDDRRPATPWHRTIIYEAHLKGFTALNAQIPARLRGTYEGLASESAISYLKELGITAIELLPIHHHAIDGHLVDHGLVNYWGYNTLSYFAPDTRYSASKRSTDAVREFKTMVKALHAAGIEVILDVVYNHTAEGSQLGPTLSLRGIDNASYYRLVEKDRRYYQDFTGCGNTLNMLHPRVLQLIMDSLRYWVTEMHVDGFRFDLASALARELFAVDKLGAFFDIIHQDPIISQVKLIAEPWDLGEGGYQVGNFPTLWSEWNGRYRDTVRDFGRGADRTLADFAYRLTGSSDLYGRTGRRPYASVNFVTAHDGFTLTDLVSYDAKHNEANGEDNRDGTDDNRSWNSGVEGPTDDPAVLELRDRRKRTFLATLLLSQGVPMLRHCDELGHTQHGNNNAYCQDNGLSWLDWENADAELSAFTAELVAFRHGHPVFRRRRFFEGRPIFGSGVSDIAWFRPDGGEMTAEDWQVGFAKSLGVFLNGDALPDPDPQGWRVDDDTFLLLFNAHYEDVAFTLPPSRWATRWRRELDTAAGAGPLASDEHPAGGTVVVAARSMQVLRRTEADAAGER